VLPRPPCLGLAIGIHNNFQHDTTIVDVPWPWYLYKWHPKICDHAKQPWTFCWIVLSNSESANPNHYAEQNKAWAKATVTYINHQKGW
jgi:hypothetical protein